MSISDRFFFYDTTPVPIQNEGELVELLAQPKRSQFYNRRYGVGVHDSEDFSNTIGMQVGLRYDIVNAIAYRNTIVADGSRGLPDRRIAASFESVGVEQKANGRTDVSVFYSNLQNYEQLNSVSLPIGRQQ